VHECPIPSACSSFEGGVRSEIETFIILTANGGMISLQCHHLFFSSSFFVTADNIIVNNFSGLSGVLNILKANTNELSLLTSLC
jgi:hypothetical protein